MSSKTAARKRWKRRQRARQLELELTGGLCSGPLFKHGPQLRPSLSPYRGRNFYKKLKRATPPWADLEAIRRVYEEAQALTKATGLQHNVDHIIPLKGETVCGLHVEYNLRVMLKEDNMRKGNSFVEQLHLMLDILDG